MSSALHTPTAESTDTDNSPYVIVSVDTHTGPYVRADLREYCEAKYLPQFDAYCDVVEAHMDAALAGNTFMPIELPQKDYLARRRSQSLIPGIVDPHARLADMNGDGIAAEIIYHGALNEQPIPFSSTSLLSWSPPDFDELEPVGIHIYNRWLADFVSVEPERRVGTAHIPIRDIDAAVKEVEWARENGLKAVNLPAPRRDFASYLDPMWEPLWAACAASNMVLNTHAGGGDSYQYPGEAATAVYLMEAMFFARRAMPMLVFGGVFERYPNLKMCLTELHSDWVPEAIADMQSAFHSYLGHGIRQALPREPAEYFQQNVFIGASFMAHHEALEAIDRELEDKFLWGSDYPHAEGCWPRTAESLRFSFHDIPVPAVRKFLGENAMNVYDIDRDALTLVAERIGPRPTDVARPLNAAPDWEGLAFRTIGKYS